ncbi:MAG: chemotaxis protein CheB [Alphaproteobacteria bacterium]|nr:MAG: chemotaxis protein CheB [Alphaproteobacteria bacterium]
MITTGTNALVIGASAGAVQALLEILPILPADYPLAVLVAVHVPPDRDNVLVPLLQSRCRIRIKEAEDKERLMPGTVYFAPSDYHLLVEHDRSLALSSDEVVNYSRPSIDVLFESAADAFGSGLVGVILTGANQDGAEGLEAVIRAGGHGIVEDPGHAYASTMPEAALKACAKARAMRLEEIAHHLARLAK